jgi:mannose/fructose/N-acetylgalactosamine-specific phosphotransferase system component IIC
MQSGPTIWLILLTVGVAVLGLIMAFGATRNGRRTRQERIRTEAATAREYEAESRDNS